MMTFPALLRLRMHSQKISSQACFSFEQAKIAVFARVGKTDRHTLEDRRGFGAHNQDLLGEKHRFADAVRHEDDRLAGLLPGSPRSLRAVISSRPLKGSSINRMSGSMASARAIDTRCCMPPES